MKYMRIAELLVFGFLLLSVTSVVNAMRFGDRVTIENGKNSSDEDESDSQDESDSDKKQRMALVVAEEERKEEIEIERQEVDDVIERMLAEVRKKETQKYIKELSEKKEILEDLLREGLGDILNDKFDSLSKVSFDGISMVKFGDILKAIDSGQESKKLYQTCFELNKLVREGDTHAHALLTGFIKLVTDNQEKTNTDKIFGIMSAACFAVTNERKVNMHRDVVLGLINGLSQEPVLSALDKLVVKIENTLPEFCYINRGIAWLANILGKGVQHRFLRKQAVNPGIFEYAENSAQVPIAVLHGLFNTNQGRQALNENDDFEDEG